MLTARLRLSRLIPHSTAWRALYSSGSNAGGRPPALPLLFRLRTWVGLVGDGAPDPPPPQVGAISPGTVGLIGQHPPRPGAGTATPGPGHPDTFQHGLELRAVAALPGGDDDRQRLLPLFTRQMDLGGQAPARAAQSMVSRLGRAGPARRLTLPVPLPAGTSRMLMRPAHRGIDADLPADRPGRIRSPLQPADNPRPGAITLPAAE